MESKKISLKDFLLLIPTRRNLFYNIVINGEPDEKQMLEDLCNLHAKNERLNEAWNEIFYSLNENFCQLDDVTHFFTEKTLNFLINNELALCSLGHLQLSDEWLLKIYEKDDYCVEALLTVAKRHGYDGLMVTTNKEKLKNVHHELKNLFQSK